MFTEEEIKNLEGVFTLARAQTVANKTQLINVLNFEMQLMAKIEAMNKEHEEAAKKESSNHVDENVTS